MAAVKAWYAETSRPAYVVGPLHPSGSQAAASEKKQSKEAEEVQALLDSTLKASGEHSLLYVSPTFKFRTCLRLTMSLAALDLLRVDFLAN